MEDPSSPAAAPRLPKLVCLDFDGTIVGDGVSEVFLRWLEVLSNNGALWVVNTGRTLFHALEGIQDHNIRPLPHYIIAKEREIFAPGQFNRWVDFGKWNRRCQKEHARLFKSCRKFLGEVQEFVAEKTHAEFVATPDDPAGIIAATNEEMDRICAFIEEHHNLPKELSYERNSIYLRFSHIGYNKGTALTELARMLEISSADVFVAGDSHNDVSMLDREHAGMIACPVNAIDEIKALVAANDGYIAGRPASEGVAEAFAYFFAGEGEERRPEDRA
ncbi:MAG: HAD-IIB family hydrolase [Verrucomicrobiota bacterium]